MRLQAGFARPPEAISLLRWRCPLVEEVERLLVGTLDPVEDEPEVCRCQEFVLGLRQRISAHVASHHEDLMQSPFAEASNELVHPAAHRKRAGVVKNFADPNRSEMFQLIKVVVDRAYRKLGQEGGP